MNDEQRSDRRVWVMLVRCLALLLVAGLAGCGIDDDAAPRVIADGSGPNLASTANQATGASSGTDRIYLLAPESPSDARRLRPTQRNVGDSATQRLQSLFNKLTVAENSARLRTAIPDGLLLRSAVLQARGTLVVDVSDRSSTCRAAR